MNAPSALLVKMIRNDEGWPWVTASAVEVGVMTGMPASPYTGPPASDALLVRCPMTPSTRGSDAISLARCCASRASSLSS